MISVYVAVIERPRTEPAQLEHILARAGTSRDELDPLLVERICLLAEGSETVTDSLCALEIAEHVFRHCAAKGRAFTPIEEATVRLGTLLSDIGKTGPLRASPAQQKLIVDMFSIEGVPSGQISVDEFLHTYFPSDADARVLAFESLGYARELTMREFWNLHVGWTLDLLRERAPFSEVVPAAASHHLLEHNNPESIVTDDGSFAASFGTNIRFDRVEKLIVVLDKYDAARRRSRLDHDAALAWLRVLIGKNPRFGRDEQFADLLKILDEVITAEHVTWG